MKMSKAMIQGVTPARFTPGPTGSVGDARKHTKEGRNQSQYKRNGAIKLACKYGILFSTWVLAPAVPAHDTQNHEDQEQNDYEAKQCDEPADVGVSDAASLL